MTVKPIDLQTNIAQSLEVGKSEHARMGLAGELQHVLDKEAKDKSNLVNSRLDEAEKGEKTAIRAEDKKKDRHGRDSRGRKDGDSDKRKTEKINDDKMGRIIDVFK